VPKNIVHWGLKKYLFWDYQEIKDLNKTQRTSRRRRRANESYLSHSGFATAGSLRKIQRRTCEAHERVSRSLRWDNDRNPHARSATASRVSSLTRRSAPHPLKLILAAFFCRRGRGYCCHLRVRSDRERQRLVLATAARFRSWIQSRCVPAIPRRCAHCSVTAGTNPGYRFRLPRANNG